MTALLSLEAVLDAALQTGQNWPGISNTNALSIAVTLAGYAEGNRSYGLLGTDEYRISLPTLRSAARIGFHANGYPHPLEEGLASLLAAWQDAFLRGRLAALSLLRVHEIAIEGPPLVYVGREVFAEGGDIWTAKTPGYCGFSRALSPYRALLACLESLEEGPERGFSGLLREPDPH